MNPAGRRKVQECGTNRPDALRLIHVISAPLSLGLKRLELETNLSFILMTMLRMYVDIYSPPFHLHAS